MTHQPLISIQNVSAHYGKIRALNSVSLDVQAGEIVTLIGANGAGKSTLMMSLFGMPRITSGTITYQGHDITHTPSHEIAKRGIIQVPEGRHIFPAMTVRENLQMGAAMQNFKFYDADLQKVYELFPILKQRQAQRGGTLSGGEQQMLAIGRALMCRPTLLLLDEPSLGLAPLIVQNIFSTIRELNEDGLSIFLVEQNAYHALKLAHHAHVMVTGQIIMSGTGDELFEKDEIRAAYLEGATLKSDPKGVS